MSTLERSRLSAAVVAALVLSLLAASRGAGQTVEQFYEGRQLRFIVHTGAGGDYDMWTRLLARHMGRHLPGHPSFIVQNMPGGGGLVAANALYANVPRDGSVLGMIGRNLPYQAAMKVENVRYDPARFNWIGSPETGNTVCVVTAAAPARTARDLYAHEVLMGGAGAGTAVSLMPVFLNRLLGLKLKLVEGYGSAVNINLAMDRGEVHGLFVALNAVHNFRPGWLAAGKLRILFNMEEKPVPGLGAPSIFELAKTEEQRQLLSLLSISNDFGRPVLAPPDVPADRVAALRRAFEAALKDPELMAEAKKAGLEVTLISGDELTGLVRRLQTTPASVIDKMNQLSR